MTWFEIASTIFFAYIAAGSTVVVYLLSEHHKTKSDARQIRQQAEFNAAMSRQSISRPALRVVGGKQVRRG